MAEIPDRHTIECNDCGRQRLMFTVSNEVWQAIVGDPSKVLCFECFHLRAIKKKLVPAMWFMAPMGNGWNGFTVETPADEPETK